MRRILLAWIGNADLTGADDEGAKEIGPIAQALDAFDFAEARFLCNYPQDRADRFMTWLGLRTEVPLHVRHVTLTGPTEFAEIYEVAAEACREALRESPRAVRLTLHLSPGTPAMQAVWILIGKTQFDADFVESSREQGTREVSIPFDIAADFVPRLLELADERAARRAAAEPPVDAAFADIIHRSAVMRRVVERARTVAARSVPVLIEGDSGTGKELFARAIHDAGPRQEKPFVAVNCGALPGQLVEAELFGYEKGAFTGAHRAHPGCFERAHGGTLLLDEIGELPLEAQVKLLRVLQDMSVTRIGGSEARKVDVRIIAATNRSLLDEIQAGRFRDDLYYRLAVGVLRLPPLREREGDVGLLITKLLAQVNEAGKEDPGYRPRELTAGARRALLAHSWPGNVREMLNTLHRAALWCPDEKISETDVLESLQSVNRGRPEDLLHRPIGEDGIDLRGLISELARHYLERSLEQAEGNKSEAARLCGLSSYQTFDNWLERYGVGAKGPKEARGVRAVKGAKGRTGKGTSRGTRKRK